MQTAGRLKGGFNREQRKTLPAADSTAVLNLLWARPDGFDNPGLLEQIARVGVALLEERLA